MGNYMAQEELMKSHTRVWRNAYDTASVSHSRYYKYFAKHKRDFLLILRRQV